MSAAEVPVDETEVVPQRETAQELIRRLTGVNETQSLVTQGGQVEVKPLRDAHGRLLPGHTANKHGGRPKKIREIEKMLNKHHRDVDKMREVFDRLRALAMGETILVPFVNEQGEFALKCELQADARFMQLYLDRLLGPARAFEDNLDLSDAPSEVLEYLRIRVSR